MKVSKQDGVWAIIHCPAIGSFLFGKRSAQVKKPGLWNLFGGTIDAGETPRSALLRELTEETGFELAKSDLVRVRGASDVDLQGPSKVEVPRQLHYFFLRLDREVEPKLNYEHSDSRWFMKNKLPRDVNRPTAIALNIGLIEKVLRVCE